MFSYPECLLHTICARYLLRSTYLKRILDVRSITIIKRINVTSRRRNVQTFTFRVVLASRLDLVSTSDAAMLPEAVNISLNMNYVKKYMLKVDPFYERANILRGSSEKVDIDSFFTKLNRSETTFYLLFMNNDIHNN